MFYTEEPEAMRSFIRDKLGFAGVDVGDGWLIFDLPEADMGCHPADETGKQGRPSGTHDISFYCDDIHRTISQLKERGVEFVGDVEDEGFGLVAEFRMPGDMTVQLYQPKYDKDG